MQKIFALILLWVIVNLMGCAVDDKSLIAPQQYLNKIWIAEDKIEAGRNYEGYSFVMTSIENQKVEGQYLILEEEINPRKGLNSTFTGSIDDFVIQCYLWNGNECVGSMILELISEDKIKATISVSDEQSEELIFRPYSITDLSDIVIDGDMAVIAEMDKWGKVKIVSGKTNINKSYPVSFLTNEQGDILYEFEASYKTGTTIEEINVMDFNGDGLDDVELVTYFEDDTIEPIRWIFYRDAEATFHLEKVI